MSGREPTQRLIERELIEGLGRERRRSLLDRLRGNVEARRRWDRGIAAFRVLEDRAVSRQELEQVERWLFEDLADDGVLAGESGRRRRWLTPVLAGLSTLAAATAALLLLIDDGAKPDRGGAGSDPGSLMTIVGSGELQARGGLEWPRPLAIDPVCGRPSRPASERGCGLDELMGFSLRLDATLAEEPGATSYLSLFGLDAAGELTYYAPTPDGATGSERLLVGPGTDGEARWQALPLSVRLGVHHHPGLLRLYAIATPDPADPRDVERWAAALRQQAPAGVDDPPWHLRLRSADLGPTICAGTRRRCASAETILMIHTHVEAHE